MAEEKRNDNDPSMALIRKVAHIFAKVFIKIGITPNQITILRFIIFVPLIIFFITRGTYIYNLIALGIIIFVATLDLCDGLVARMTSSSSKFGAWLDGSLDSIFLNSFLVIVTIMVFQGSGEIKWLIVGLILVFGQNMANVMGAFYDKNFGFEACNGSNEFNNKFTNISKISLPDSYFKNIIVPTKLIYYFLFTTRYLLALGILINRLDLFLLSFAITINIRWVSMWLLSLMYFSSKQSKLYTVKFLREIKNRLDI